MAEEQLNNDLQKYIDLDAALARIRGNKKIYKRMLSLFLQSTEFESFENALAQKDYTKAADTAHAIKGMTGNLSLTVVFEESTKLMVQLRQGPPDEDTLAKYREALVATKVCVESAIARFDAEGV